MFCHKRSNLCSKRFHSVCFLFRAFSSFLVSNLLISNFVKQTLKISVVEILMDFGHTFLLKHVGKKFFDYLVRWTCVQLLKVACSKSMATKRFLWAALYNNWIIVFNQLVSNLFNSFSRFVLGMIFIQFFGS